MAEYEPKVVCFSCKFSWGYLSSEASISSTITRWIPIICTGKVDATYIFDAFREGADGVLILGCPEGDCHYQDGNIEAKKRVYLLLHLLESHGIEKERLRIELGIDPGGKRILQLVTEMSADLRKLGPLKMSSTAKMVAAEPAKMRGGN